MCCSCQRIFSQCKPDLTADSSIESDLKFLLVVHINTPQVLYMIKWYLTGLTAYVATGFWEHI